MGTVLSNARVVTPDGVIDPGWVKVSDGKITEVGGGSPGNAAAVDLGGQWLLPGFVDIHVHGGGGTSYQAGDRTEVANAVAFHRTHGTTTTVASLVSGTLADLERATAALADLVAEGLLAGIHLEGPFLSPARCGAHEPALLRPPHPDDVDRLLAAGRGAVRMVTLAPELEHGIEAVRRVADAGAIAAVGHTDATYEVVRQAIDAGATVATHLFNAMRPIHHREPGPVVALIEDERVAIEVIADKVHVHPAVLAMVAHHVDPARLVLVTDAMAAAGIGDGEYVLGGLGVRVADGVARLIEGGAIAGSTLTMDVAVRTAVESGISIVDAARAAATNPARLLGLGDRVGAIRAGLDADLVVMDAVPRVTAVMKRGAFLVPPTRSK